MSWKPSQHIEQFMQEQYILQSSLNTYRRNLSVFFRWVVEKNIPFDQIGRSHLIQFLRDMEAAGRSANTINGYLTVFRQFFQYLDNLNLHNNIAKGLRNRKRPLTFAKEALTEPQVKRLLESIDRSTMHGLRDYTMAYLMISNGLRCIEVSRLRHEDLIRSGDEYVLRVQRKGRSTRDQELPLTDDVLEALRTYQHYFKELSDWMFPSMNNAKIGKQLSARSVGYVVKRRLELMGLHGKRYTAHSLRHTTAVMALEGGVDIYDVQLLMGHSNPSTTTVYLQSVKQRQKQKNIAGRRISEILRKNTNNSTSAAINV